MINELDSNAYDFNEGLFYVKYNNLEETINPPHCLEKLREIICYKFKINENDKQFLQIYHNNTLINNEEDYLKLKNIYLFNIFNIFNALQNYNIL